MATPPVLPEVRRFQSFPLPGDLCPPYDDNSTGVSSKLGNGSTRSDRRAPGQNKTCRAPERASCQSL